MSREDERETRTTKVTLDIGRRDGAFPGLLLFGTEGLLELTSVEESTSVASFEDFGADGPLPSVGWELVTRRTEDD